MLKSFTVSETMMDALESNPMSLESFVKKLSENTASNMLENVTRLLNRMEDGEQFKISTSVKRYGERARTTHTPIKKYNVKTLHLILINDLDRRLWV